MRFSSATYRILACLLALLVFSTSVSFAMDLHYCGGKLRSASFYGKAKSCHEQVPADAPKACARHHARPADQQAPHGAHCLDRAGCCGNKAVHVQADQDRVVTTLPMAGQEISLPVPAPLPVFLTAAMGSGYASLPFACHRPPLIPRDIPVLVQSFRL